MMNPRSVDRNVVLFGTSRHIYMHLASNEYRWSSTCAHIIS